NVVSYNKSGQREQETLSVPAASANEPVNPPGQDVEVAAQPLKSELLELLPPTMKNSNVKAETYDSEKFRRLLDINITGTFLVAQAVGQQMIKLNTGGSMINIASMSGTIVNYPQEQSCYNASKAAVIQLTKSLAAEWARYNIRVNSISPGYMDTALNRVPALDAQKRIWMDNTPQKRLGAVDDLNNLAVYLASPGSSYMTGNNCLIDGGYTL
ncbi:NAD(P)-binding protein, partial [Aureobasidium melanogenum]